MRIAVFSDIHGNCVALDAVLEDLESHSADQMICLGDAIQGGPQPAEVADRLRELGCPVVMGNADAWLVTGAWTGVAEAVTERLLEVRKWSLSILDAEQVEFVEGFERRVEIDLGDDKALLAFHGSPDSFDDIILPETPEEDFQRMLAGFSALLFTGGHTHLQWVRRLRDSFYFNPGSAGLSYDRNADPSDFRFDPWAEYALVEYEAGRVGLQFRRVPYDVDKLAGAIRRSGIPYAAEMIARYRPDG